MRKIILTFLAASALAVLGLTPVSAQNVRPAFIDVSGTNGENTMQYILDQVYGAAAVSATADQQRAGLWSALSQSSVAPILSFEYAGNAAGNSLGFFSVASGLVTRTLFAGIAGVGDVATIEWTGLDTGMISSSSCGAVLCGAFSGISWQSFGFYLNGPGTLGNAYTLDTMNGGDVQAIAYRGTGSRETDWVIGFEDITYVDSDMDYNDLVVRVGSVAAIPEPETYAMLLAGLALMGFVARRRQHGLIG